MQTYSNKTECRCCGSKNLMPYLDLCNQPLANSYHKGEKELPIFPLKVNVCKNCFHSQLSVVVDPKLMFENYLYVSGTTKTLQDYFETIVEYCDRHWKQMVNSEKGYDESKQIYSLSLPTVLDIGANDCSLLEKFRQKSYVVAGVDPARNLQSIANEKHIYVYSDYWSEEFASTVNRKFNFITALNVFAHNDDHAGFLRGCKACLDKNGLILIEFPYNKSMLLNNEFDQQYHEHLSSFLVHSFSKLVERVDLQIVDVIETPVHGGTVRFVLSHSNSMWHERTVQIEHMISQEKKLGLCDLDSYDQFQNRVDKNCQDLKNYVVHCRLNNKKIVGFGASAKSSVLLNFSEVKLDYIVDNNPLKWNHYTPGINIPIFPTEKLAEEQDELSIVILSWNFYEEIKAKIKAIRGSLPTKLVSYVPKFEVVDLNEQ